MADATLSTHLLSIDIETSGTDPRVHGIIELGAVHVESGVEFEAQVRHTDLVVAPEAMRVNKVDVSTLDDPARKPLGQVDFEFLTWLAELKRTQNITGRLIAVGYNVASFDLAFINAQMSKSAAQFAHRAIELNSLCFAEDLRENRTTNGFELGRNKKFVREMNPNLNAHTALADARMSAEDLRLLTGWRGPRVEPPAIATVTA